MHLPATALPGSAMLLTDAAGQRIGAAAFAPRMGGWAPGGSYTIAQLGYTPANRAGDTFTGLVQAPSLGVKEGTNARMGTATLAAGVATVATNQIAANSRVFLTSQVDGGAPGFLRVSSRVAGTSFTITSGSATDTSTVAWVILSPY